jgi:hypothetical protein
MSAEAPSAAVMAIAYGAFVWRSQSRRDQPAGATVHFNRLSNLGRLCVSHKSNGE